MQSTQCDSRVPPGCFVFRNVVPAEFRVPAGHSVWGARATFGPGLHLVAAPSGRGKSTLVNLLADLRLPSSGSILRPSPQRTRSWSLLAQDLAVPPGIRISRIFELGLPGQEPPARDAVTAQLARLRVDKAPDTPAATLSRGELQRVLFLRALLQDSDWIFLDEPFSHVDSAIEAEMWNMLQTELAGGRSVLLTSVEADNSASTPAVVDSRGIFRWRL